MNCRPLAQHTGSYLPIERSVVTKHSIRAGDWSKIIKKSVDIVETLRAEEFKPSKTVLRFPASTPMFQHGQGTGFGLKSASSLSD